MRLRHCRLLPYLPALVLVLKAGWIQAFGNLDRTSSVVWLLVFAVSVGVMVHELLRRYRRAR